MDGDKWMIVGGILAVVIVIEWLRAKAFQYGRLAGMREAVMQLSRNCSFHYEEQDKPLPKKVDEALDYMAKALTKSGTTKRIEFYVIGAGMLGSAMGEAAWHKGYDSGRQGTEPRDDDRRIDMPIESWRWIRYLAHIGFLHQMPNYRRLLDNPFRSEDDAKRAESAIERLEFAIGHSKSDPEYSASLQRNMLVWEQWPKQKA